ncbi:MAG: Nif3-like dinuclear metal center hexameric protein [Bdellovibrionales bacterium]|nr:Nif3-like dinuclear metal center hexameric protein [Bdellovibrionales bacterium]
MTQLASIVSYLDSLLSPQLYTDSSLNGLQVESSVSDIRRVAVAVDAGLDVIRAAADMEANLLIVHHGLMWGGEQPIRGTFGKKIELLLKSGISLYVSHLPLDGNLEVGNGAELARFLDLQEIKPFCEVNGMSVGVRGCLKSDFSIEHFQKKASQMLGAVVPLCFEFGKSDIRDVAVVTGSGSSALDLCAEQRIDLLVSGEPKHEAYQRAKELKMNAIFLGHYASETFGVRALARRLATDFDLEHEFIDDPSGI